MSTISPIGVVSNQDISNPGKVQSDVESVSITNIMEAAQSLPNIVVGLKESTVDVADFVKKLGTLEDDFRNVRDNLGTAAGAISLSSEERAEAFSAMNEMSESLRNIADTAENFEKYRELKDSIDRLDLVIDSTRDTIEQAPVGTGFSVQQPNGGAASGISLGTEDSWGRHKLSTEFHLSVNEDTNSTGAEARMTGPVGNTNWGYHVAGRVNFEAAVEGGGLDLSINDMGRGLAHSYHAAASLGYHEADFIGDMDLKLGLGAGVSGGHNPFLDNDTTQFSQCAGIGLSAGLKNREYDLTASYNGVSCDNQDMQSDIAIGFNYEPDNNNVFSIEGGVKHNALTGETKPFIGIKSEI